MSGGRQFGQPVGTPTAGSIVTSMLAAGAVTTALIATGAVGTTEIEDGAVDDTKINTSVLAADGDNPLTGDLDANSNSIVGLAAPTLGGDAVNKTYADALGGGGAVVQVQFDYFSGMSTGTDVVVNDDTVPQYTEGNIFLTTAAFTPTSAGSTLHIEASANLYNSTDNYCVLHVHEDTDADAIMSGQVHAGGAAFGDFQLDATAAVPASTTDPRTYAMIIGCTAGTLTINGHNGTARLGGTMFSGIKITEVAP